MLEFCHAQGAAAGISFPPIEDLQEPFDAGRVLQIRTRQPSSIFSQKHDRHSHRSQPTKPPEDAMNPDSFPALSEAG
jgi:hypothetical protein